MDMATNWWIRHQQERLDKSYWIESEVAGYPLQRRYACPYCKEWQFGMTNYCPHCGKEMRKEEFRNADL